MRILFCNDNLKLGGAQRRLVQLILGLNAKGFTDIHVILTNKEIIYDGVLNSSAKFYFLDRNVTRCVFYREFKKLLKQINPDIVHCWSMHQAYYLNFISFFSNFKYVCGTITTANKFSPKSSQFYVERLSFWLSDIIVTNSYAGLKAKGAPINKSKVIYNGYNFSRQHNLKSEIMLREELRLPNQHIITMASRVSPQKDIEMLIKVAILLENKRNDVTILMLGDGPQLEYYRNIVCERGIHNIKFLGYRNDVESIIHISTLCILCSKHEEGVSNSIMESLADGKPVIATKSGGTSEIIFSGENGFIVSPGDAVSMVKIIEFLLDNPKERKKIGKRAVEIINQKFLLSHMVDEYMMMYNSINNK